MFDFFSQDDVKDSFIRYINELKNNPASDEFEKERNGYIFSTLHSMTRNSDHWNDKTPFNIETIHKVFLDQVQERSPNSYSMNLVFAIIVRFCSEEYLNNPNELANDYSKLRFFCRGNVGKFDDTSRSQIEYAFHDMPASILRKMIHGQEVGAIKDFSKAMLEAKELKEKWDNEINQKKNQVEQLQQALDKQEDAFNFVGLYAGFSKLGRIKAIEHGWAKKIMFALGFLIPIPLLAEFFYLLYLAKSEQESSMLTLIPMTSLTLLLIYYFRISLSNYNSIKAQLMQIELRKSLCRFIQNYAEYSKCMKNENGSALDKFESIIFSNIMVSEDKIPSTFDGVEQMASLLNAIKK